ncbi:MAG: response regulator [Chitinophagaceae bacterium]|nr:response regulator [Chitinophagaceae bacterium]
MLTIECRLADKIADKDFVEIIVTDTGIGIEKEYLPFIFDKFTQEESGQVKKFGGTGLGMSISRQLVELMNGTITVTSEKNKGTIVSVIIPLKAAKGKSVTSLKTVESGLLVSKKILVAEDNEINATVIKSLLTREGAHVLLVNNGKELIDAIAKEDFDLVISDLQMPVMGGMEAVKWVRKHKPPTQQIIALTANAFKEERERCLEAGFNEVLFKPFKKEDLIKARIDNNYQNSNNEYAGQVNASPKLYNLDSLTEMVDGNKDQVAYLIQQFLEETPRKIEKINIALQQDKGKEIRRVVHYLSSSLHHMSVTALYDSIKKIETSKRNKLSKNQQMEVKHFCEMTQLVVDQISEDYPANNSLVK